MSHPAAEPRERTIAKSALKHRKLNHVILNLAMLEFHASDTFERGTMFVEIVDGFVLRPKRRLELAHLPSCANRQHEGNDLPLVRLGFWHHPHTLEHVASSVWD